MNFRIGHGYDVHQLEEGRDFWLGGIKINHTHGAIGHSDADVLIHAICDSLLGAANLKDIGYHFSNKDPKYKGIDSKILLAESVAMVRKAGYDVGNIDTTLLLQEPKISPYIDEMRKVLAKVLEISENDISIKATTTETLGFVGRKEGVSAYASALIYKK
jgi:2-C-methyl-D-erythritol 2,4-cyclodiphosphate synthase